MLQISAFLGGTASREDAVVRKMEDLAKIMKPGGIVPPAPAIAGETKVAGEMPKAGEIVKLPKWAWPAPIRPADRRG